MILPYDKTKIENTIEAYKRFLFTTLDLPLLSFDELSQLDGNTRGIYLAFEDDELMYVGMTKNIKTRMLDMTSIHNRHSLYQIYFDFELEKVVHAAFNTTLFDDKTKQRLLDENILTKEDIREYKNKAVAKIKTLKFKFYPTELYNMRDLEHFCIAILNPVYNQ